MHGTKAGAGYETPTMLERIGITPSTPKAPPASRATILPGDDPRTKAYVEG